MAEQLRRLGLRLELPRFLGQSGMKEALMLPHAGIIQGQGQLP